MIFEGFSPVYVINLKRRPERKQHMIDNFYKYGIKNYFFIDAIDGKDNIDNLLINKPEVKDLRNIEIAATISHLTAIKTWIKESDSEYAIICEDDLSFKTTEFWNFSWKDFFNLLPPDFDVVQLSIVYTEVEFDIELHKRIDGEYSAAVYLIKRDYAKKILNRYCVGDKYKFPNSLKYIVTDHSTIFGSKNSYSMPLFITSNRFETDNTGYVDSTDKEVVDFQNWSRYQILHKWQKNTLSIKELMKHGK